MHVRIRWTSALRPLGVLAAGCLLFVTFRDVHFGEVGEHLTRVGPMALSILVPYALSIGAESIAWRWIYGLLGCRVPLRGVLRVRVSTEAVALTVPGGPFWSEGLNPALLRRHCGLPLASSIAGMAARKYLLVMTQALYLGFVFVWAAGDVLATSERLLGSAGFGWALPFAALVLAGVALASGIAFAHGTLGMRVFRGLCRIPGARVRAFLSGREANFVRIDQELSRFFEIAGRRSLGPATLVLSTWFFETLETFVILRVLGVELDFPTIAALEATSVMVRHVAFFIPAGLGAQDLTYVALLGALGVPSATSIGATFVLLKRAKEGLWVAAGYLLLLDDGMRPAGSGPSPLAHEHPRPDTTPDAGP